MSFDSVDGNFYASSNTWPRTWLQNAFKESLKPLKSRYDKMLDIGCGSGQDTLLLSEYFHVDKILGIDRNKSYIEYAMKNSIENSETRYEICDLNKDTDLQLILEYNGDIDLVVSSFVMNWVENPLNIFKAVSTFLKNGAVEHLYIWTIKYFEPTTDIVHNIPHHPKWKDYLKNVKDIPQSLTKEKPSIPSEEFHQKLSEMRYEICNEKIMEMTFQFNSYEEEIGCLRWLLPFTQHIPVDLQDEFLHDCWNESRKKWNYEEKYFMKGDVYLLHMKSN